MKTSWGGVASWYDEVVNIDDSYQSKVILPNILRLVKTGPDNTILDLACGQGFFSHAFAKNGANVFGVDIAPELIKIANKNKSKRESFFVSPAHKLSNFENKKFDTVVCVLAIQNISNISEVFKEVSRVVRDGGKFFIVLNHPIFRIPGKSSWGFDDDKKIQFRRVDEYLSESKKEIDMHPGDNKKILEKNITYSFHRPLQVYSKLLFNNGFAISRIEEWVSHKKSENGPKKQIEDKARKEFPMFMCIECLKGV